MDLYLEQFIDDMVSNLQYRNGIFKNAWDYTVAGLVFIVALPLTGLLALKGRFY